MEKSAGDPRGWHISDWARMSITAADIKSHGRDLLSSVTAVSFSPTRIYLLKYKLCCTFLVSARKGAFLRKFHLYTRQGITSLIWNTKINLYIHSTHYILFSWHPSSYFSPVYLYLGLASDLFTIGFAFNILCTFLVYATRFNLHDICNIFFVSVSVYRVSPYIMYGVFMFIHTYW